MAPVITILAAVVAIMVYVAASSLGHTQDI